MQYKCRITEDQEKQNSEQELTLGHPSSYRPLSSIPFSDFLSILHLVCLAIEGQA